MRKTIATFVVFLSFAGVAQANDLPNAKAIIAAINTQRQENGLPVLAESPSLDQAAALKAQSLTGVGALVHTQAPSGTPWWPLSQAGYTYKSLGENLAANYFDVNSLVTDWMNSPEHRINIVNPQVKDIGVAVVEGTYQGESSDYIVEYTALSKSPETFIVSEVPDIKQGIVLGTTIKAQATGVDSGDAVVMQTLMEKIVELLKQILALQGKKA